MKTPKHAVDAHMAFSKEMEKYCGPITMHKNFGPDRCLGLVGINTLDGSVLLITNTRRGVVLPGGYIDKEDLMADRIFSLTDDQSHMYP